MFLQPDYLDTKRLVLSSSDEQVKKYHNLHLTYQRDDDGYLVSGLDFTYNAAFEKVVTIHLAKEREQ